jgi:tyrosyl-tRNA synthetase
MSTRLGASHDALMSLLRADPALGRAPEILDLLAARRALDLSDLAPAEQATLLAARVQEVLPSVGELRDRLADGPLVVKFGIDPTAADVHVGHTVPMLLATRLARMGHRVVFVVGDVTARIGDPSGRSGERPALSIEDVQRNVASYRAQMAPFVDVGRSDLRHNSRWLGEVRLPDFLAVLARLPVSAALQRDDFRTRLAAGHGLSVAELVYSVVMALDSVEIAADVEIGGLDQLLNLRMCRRVMEQAGQRPELVLATPLIEGTDGSGAKMSKSRGNYVALTSAPAQMFGRLMSAPDRLLPSWLRALTELLDPEVDLLLARHPMAVKALLAADVTAAVHGRPAATDAAADFAARFSRRRLSAATGVPVVDRSTGLTVAAALVTFAGVVSRNQVRRVAAGGGLRLVREDADGGGTRTLTAADADAPLTDLPVDTGVRTFLRCGRAVVELR